MSKRSVLILGGTGYFGKHLVKMLLNHGDHITIATRGINPIPRGCSFIQFDRNINNGLLKKNDWDLIYDQSGYSSESLENLKSIIANCGQYIFTSSQAVYPPGLTSDEESVDHHFIDNYKNIINDYGIDKLKSELFIKNLTQNYVFPRFPVVVGVGDPRRRIQELVYKILSGSICLPSSNPTLQMLDEWDAAKVLFEIPFKKFTGPINIATEDAISSEKLCRMIADKLNLDLNIEWSTNFKSSPFDLIKLESKTLATKKQKTLGFEVNQISSVIANIINNSDLMEMKNYGSLKI